STLAPDRRDARRGTAGRHRTHARTLADRPVIDPTDTKGAHALERLSRELIGWLTTVTQAGQPQSMPVWFLWVDGEILFYSRAGALRNRNLESNPRVSFHLNDDGRGDDLISIDGEARFDPDA